MKWRVPAGFAIALLVLALLVFFVGWEDVLSAVDQTEPQLFALAFGSTLVALLFRSFVWVRLLGVLGHSLSRPLVSGIFLSAKFFKYITPYGQVAATPGIALYVASWTKIDYEQNLAAIAGADFFTYSPYYTFGAIGVAYLLLSAASFPRIELYLVAAVAVVSVLVFAFYVVLVKRTLTRRFITRLLAPFAGLLERIDGRLAREFTPARIEERLTGFYVTVDDLSEDRPTLLAGLAYGHIGWFFLMLPLVITAAAMGIELGVFLAMVVIALSKLGFAVPLPGGIGGVELTIAGLLFLIAGIGMAQATAIAILYRLAVFWFTMALGGLTAASMITFRPYLQS